MAKTSPDELMRHSPKKLFEYVGKYEAIEKEDHTTEEVNQAI